MQTLNDIQDKQFYKNTERKRSKTKPIARIPTTENMESDEIKKYYEKILNDMINQSAKRQVASTMSYQSNQENKNVQSENSINTVEISASFFKNYKK